MLESCIWVNAQLGCVILEEFIFDLLYTGRRFLPSRIPALNHSSYMQHVPLLYICVTGPVITGHVGTNYTSHITGYTVYQYWNRIILYSVTWPIKCHGHRVIHKTSYESWKFKKLHLVLLGVFRDESLSSAHMDIDIRKIAKEKIPVIIWA